MIIAITSVKESDIFCIFAARLSIIIMRCMKRVLKHIHEHIADEINVTELANVATSRQSYR